MPDAGPALLGYFDNEPLLGWSDNEELGGWLDEVLPPIGGGGVDVVGGPVGGPVGERVYIISATLFPDWNQQSGLFIDADAFATASYPTAGRPFGGVETEGDSAFVLRAASQHFVTRADDPDLPSVYWDDRVIDPGSVSLSLPLVPVGEAVIESTIGQVLFDNSDGALDVLLDQYGAVSQSVDIKAGTLGSHLVDFVTVLRARVTGVGMTEADAVLELQDPLLYAQNHYPTTIYTGIGNANGDADLEGVVKPVVLGRVWNVGAVLINAAGLIFQVHDGTVAAITGVFDGGVALSFGANHPSYSALAAASVAPGTYSTCLVQGMIRVGDTPVYALTAHVDGHSTAGTTVQSISGWLIGQLAISMGLSVDSGSFDEMPTSIAGWSWNDNFTFNEAISRFVGDAGFYWGTDVAGTIRVIRLDPPDEAEVVAAYGPEDIMAIERAPLPAGYEGVHHRRVVRYQKNWTVQTDSDLAATAVNRGFRQKEWKTAAATVVTTARNSLDPPILETSLASLAPATTLATHLLTLHGTPRKMFSLETRIFGGIAALGSSVRVKYPRFGLNLGSVFRVVGTDMRLSDSSVTYLLWG